MKPQKERRKKGKRQDVGPCAVCAPTKPQPFNLERLAKANVMQRSCAEMWEMWRRQNPSPGEAGIQEVVESVFTATELSVQPAELRSLPGAHLAAFVELERLRAKSHAAAEVAANLYRRGHPTWSSVDAYHCSFLTAKVILGMFGIFIVTLNGNNYFLDIVPESGDEKHKKAFLTHNRSITDAVRFITSGGSRIEHRHVWIILSRLAQVCTFEKLTELESRWIKLFNFSDYKSQRNKIIYRGYYWSSFGDLSGSIGSMKSLTHNSLFTNFHDNLWVEDELCDHFFMNILMHFVGKLYNT